MRSNPEHIKILLEQIQRQIDGGIVNYEKSLNDMKRRKPKVNDTRRFRLEDEDYINPYQLPIPFLEGRPLRSEPINIDDIITLNVAFRKSRTLDEFLGRV